MSHPLDGLKGAFADRYRIERELGRGGMAIVYLADDLKHHRRVALKVLKPELGQAIGPGRFLQEIEIAARLNHPHILPLHDSGEANGLLYYVMPYVEGESLRDRLGREKQLPVKDAIQIVRDVAAGLSHAHRLGVIHRDIKPENILLAADRAVLSDFGIARAVSEAGGDHLTETGLALGTPAYMSPEQASGVKDLDARTDIYSLGCVLYEMLAGQPPFTGSSAMAILARKLGGARPRAQGSTGHSAPGHRRRDHAGSRQGTRGPVCYGARVCRSITRLWRGCADGQKVSRCECPQIVAHGSRRRCAGDHRSRCVDRGASWNRTGA